MSPRRRRVNQPPRPRNKRPGVAPLPEMAEPRRFDPADPRVPKQRGRHTGHEVEFLRENRYQCHTCGVSFGIRLTRAIHRRRLLP